MWLQYLPYLLLHNVLVALLQVVGHIHHLGQLLWQVITSQLSLDQGSGNFCTCLEYSSVFQYF